MESNHRFEIVEVREIKPKVFEVTLDSNDYKKLEWKVKSSNVNERYSNGKKLKKGIIKKLNDKEFKCRMIPASTGDDIKIGDVFYLNNW